MTRVRTVFVAALVLATGTWSGPGWRAATSPLPSSAPAHNTSHRTTELDSVIAWGESVYLRGEFDSARTLWKDGLVRASVAHDSAHEGRLLTWLGLAAYRLGDYDEAGTLGEQAVALKLQAGLADDLSVSYNALGLLAWNQGRLLEATALFANASATAHTVGDEKGVAKAVNNLALV